jgi:dephospho-CoA kinase
MIIGITGSFGAGKGTAVEYLKWKHGFAHYSSSGFIVEEIVRQNLPINRDTMALVANQLREENGPSYITDSLYKRAKASGERVVIESLRAVAEVRRIKELGGVVLGIDALPEVRFAHSIARNSVKDNVTYEKWLAQELAESNQVDPNKQNIFGALKESDYIVTNNGTMEEFYNQVDEFIEKKVVF